MRSPGERQVFNPQDASEATLPLKGHAGAALGLVWLASEQCPGPRARTGPRA